MANIRHEPMTESEEKAMIELLLVVKDVPTELIQMVKTYTQGCIATFEELRK